MSTPDVLVSPEKLEELRFVLWGDLPQPLATYFSDYKGRHKITAIWSKRLQHFWKSLDHNGFEWVEIDSGSLPSSDPGIDLGGIFTVSDNMGSYQVYETPVRKDRILLCPVCQISDFTKERNPNQQDKRGLPWSWFREAQVEKIKDSVEYMVLSFLGQLDKIEKELILKVGHKERTTVLKKIFSRSSAPIEIYGVDAPHHRTLGWHIWTDIGYCLGYK